jgi:hypothetical protein
MEPAQLDFRAYYGFLFKEAKAKSDADYID